MAKICVINIQGEEISGLFTHYAKEVGARVLRPDTQLDTKSPSPGVKRAFALSSSYVTLLNKREMIEKIIEAEREGYDAAVVHCFLDPGMREAREVVNIPVFGPGESSLLLACMLGHKFAIIGINDQKVVPDTYNMLRLYGLESRAITNSVRLMTMPFKEFVFKVKEAQDEIISNVIEISKRCVAEGAETIILGCTGLGPIFTIAGVTSIPDMEVPILDCLAVAIKAAESVVDFKERLNIPVTSRACMYKPPKEKDLMMARENFGLKSF